MKTPARFIRHVLLLAAVAGFTLAGCRSKERDDRSGSVPMDAGRAEAFVDLRSIIADSLATGAKEVVIPPGRYPLQAEQGSHLAFSGLTGVTIIADGVEIVCSSTVRALSFEACTDVTIRGLTVDYDPLPFTQGTITAMAPDKSWLEFEVVQGYPEHKLAGPFQIYDPSTKSLRRRDGRWSEEIASLGNGRYRVSKAAPYQFDSVEDTERKGDILIAKNAFGKAGSPHAIELRHCKNMRLEDITIFASPSFGYLERNCHGSTLLRCIVDRRDPGDDPIKRGLPRIRSLNADAFHSKDASQGPAIISCKAHFMGDDAVNINGRYHFVRGTNGREASIIIIDNFNTIRAGDTVEFLPYSGPNTDRAKVVRRQSDPEPLNEEEKAFIGRLRMDERFRGELLGGKGELIKLTLDREINLPPGSLVCCPDRVGNGFVIRDCDFGHNRSRGILIKASNGEVSGNLISHCRMAAILVSPEFWWMEAGLPSNLMIRKNIIKGCFETPIQIHAFAGSRAVLPAGTLRNISVIENRIEDSTWPLIHVRSTSGLIIKDNLLPASPPSNGRRNSKEAPQAILLENCETTP